MDIPPIKNSLGNRWHYVKKPHLYPYKSGSVIEDIIKRLRKENGIVVELRFASREERVQAMIRRGGDR
jgi:hypothetical protein